MNTDDVDITEQIRELLCGMFSKRPYYKGSFYLGGGEASDLGPVSKEVWT